MAFNFSRSKAKLVWQLPFEGAWPTSIAFLADARLAAADQSGRILVWNIGVDPSQGIQPDPKNKDITAPSTLPERALMGHENGVTRLVSSPDGRRLYSASLDRTVRVWNLADPTSGQIEIVI